MKLTEAKLKRLILETIKESDFRPELDAEGDREEDARGQASQDHSTSDRGSYQARHRHGAMSDLRRHP